MEGVYGEPTPDGLRAARDEFRYLLGRPTIEPTWQEFFQQNRFVLSRGLPLKVLPCDILPLGRRGKSEPDFLIYPGSDKSGGQHGIIELKTHDARVLRTPRRNILTLTSNANTAVSQLIKYDATYDDFAPKPRVLTFSSQSFLFIIMGRANEIEMIDQDLRGDLRTLLTNGIRLVNFDELQANFEKDIPKKFIFLEPNWPRRPPNELDRFLSEPYFFDAVLHRLQSARFMSGDLDSIMARFREQGSRFPTRFRPPNTNIIYGAESLENAVTESVSPDQDRPPQPMAHMTFRFAGKVADIPPPSDDTKDIYDPQNYDISAQVAKRALDRGCQALRYRSRLSEAGRLVAVYDAASISDLQWQQHLYI